MSCIFALIVDITEQKKVAEELQRYRVSLEVLVQKRTAELTNEVIERKRIANSLDEKNIALREMLALLDIEKKVVRDNILNNVTMLIIPVINDLRKMGNSIDGKYLDLLEGHLKQLTSSFGTKITDLQFKLTVREMRICDLIKGGLTTKEIGKILKISPKTVESFRTSIRKKLGIKNKSINLPNYLRNF
jgi:ATP/maltotriose-dependent transcriptional regulator MalT